MTKEQVYDTQLAPLMDKVIAICREHGIGMLASYALDGDIRCTTNMADDTGKFPFARQCAEIQHGVAPLVAAITVTSNPPPSEDSR